MSTLLSVKIKCVLQIHSPAFSHNYSVSDIHTHRRQTKAETGVPEENPVNMMSHGEREMGMSSRDTNHQHSIFIVLVIRALAYNAPPCDPRLREKEERRDRAKRFCDVLTDLLVTFSVTSKQPRSLRCLESRDFSCSQLS